MSSDRKRVDIKEHRFPNGDRLVLLSSDVAAIKHVDSTVTDLRRFSRSGWCKRLRLNMLTQELWSDVESKEVLDVITFLTRQAVTAIMME